MKLAYAVGAIFFHLIADLLEALYLLVEFLVDLHEWIRRWINERRES